MKKILLLLIIIATFNLSFSSFAGEKSRYTNQTYRNSGYRGNVNFTNHIAVWFGLETSHGYMFDSKNYIGGGAAFLLLLSQTIFQCSAMYSESIKDILRISVARLPLD